MKNYYKVANNSLKEKKLPLSSKSTCINVPPISNQLIQFDHPDAEPYLFSARLNSQNCISARSIRKTFVPPINNGILDYNIQNNQPNIDRNDKFDGFEKFDKIENRLNRDSKVISKGSTIPKRALTARYRSSVNRNIPNEKQLKLIKKEIESIKPRTIMWTDTTNNAMSSRITEEITYAQKKVDKPKRIIVDNEPMDINAKPIAAPLISTAAFCRDYVGVPNSLSFM
ncbi:hypothetical protein TRFO_11546 [Tritrichomonas foetus]|uniref:Uncharacterized protein n=1 Tax=Tritrichomonas foetus TaxID=1144522 RepID=A0A1J4J4Y9_9EUKA|nr:hypothetical protein TRFO_11546 [Tritrichomonas foetus]|eukprot:OHS93761.1 hypothetical protein TRFO_11546 [Tritrichomonas foetus]